MYLATMISMAVILAAAAPLPDRGRTTVRQLANSTAQSWTCQPRRTCPQIASCAEARWYLENCSWGGKLDRDNDGIPCESIC